MDLGDPATITQAHNQGCEVAHSNTYLIYQILEHAKGLDLQSQSYKISVTQATVGYPRVAPVRAQYPGYSTSQGP